MILGVDVHEGYGRIDWHRAAKAGVQFAYVKATEGNEGCDARAKENIAGCKAAGIYVGAYLFGFPLPERDDKPGRSPEWQARRLYHDVEGLGSRVGDLPPVLDLEWPPNFERTSDGKLVNRWEEWEVTAESIVAWTVRCVDELERLFGRVPVIYTYPHFAGSLADALKDSGLERCPLWIANYTHPTAWTPPDGAKPIVPAPWAQWSVWQFSADGSPMRVPGIPSCPIDRNVMADVSALRRLAGVDGDTPTTPVLVPEARPDPLGHVELADDFHKVRGPTPLGRPEIDADLPTTPPDDDA